MINDAAIVFNLIAAAIAALYHGRLVVDYLRRRARLVALLMAVKTAVLLAFAGGYGVIFTEPTMAPVISANVFRYAVGVLFLAMTAVSRSLHHQHRATTVARAEAAAERARAAERQAMIEAMRRQEAEKRLMMEAVRKELTNRLVNNVGHEIRTPLTSVLAYTDMLLTGHFGPIPETVDPPLTAVRDGARRIGYIVDKFLVIARMQLHGPEKALTDVGALAQQVIDSDSIWINTRRKPGSIDIEYEPVQAIAYVDETAVRALLFELLHNGIKFNKPHGTVRVTITPGDDVVITVADSGIGIAGRYQMKIFEEAYQVDSDATRRFEGMGMGLALVREVAEAHGGYVQVSSKTDVGSTFHVVLPNG